MHYLLNLNKSKLPQNWIRSNNWIAFKEGKIPINHYGNPDDHVRARSSLDNAISIAKEHGQGIGYSIDNQGDLTSLIFVDLDGAIDEQGNFKEWAKPIVSEFEGKTYMQVSFSGKGLHFICEGTWNSNTRKVKYLGEHEGIEIYDSKRFVVMTGNNNMTIPVQNSQHSLDWLAKYMSDQKKLSNHSSELSQRNLNIHDEYGCRNHGDWETLKLRAMRYLENIPPAISGQGGHDHTFKTALKLVGGYNLTDEEAFEIMTMWNQSCQPPWSESELRRKISEAQKNATNRGRLLSSSNRNELASHSSENDTFPEIDFAQIGLAIVPEFPIEVFPESIATIVKGAATQIGTHSDFLSVSMLAVLGAAIGRSVEFELKPGFIVWPTGWYSLVGKVGSGKSPAIRFAERPIVEFERSLVSHNEKTLQAWEASNVNQAMEGSKRPKPSLKRLRVREATLPALIDAHSCNLFGLLYSPDELTTWLRSMDVKDRSSRVDRANWLSARQGSDISQDRISSGTRRVEKSAITVLGSIPPQMMVEITNSEDDGLLERLLFGYPLFESSPMPRPIEDEPIEDTLASDWTKIVHDLIKLRYNEAGKELTEPFFLRNSDNHAKRAYYDFEVRMKFEMDEDDGPLCGFFSKIKWDVGHWALTLALAELENRAPVAIEQHLTKQIPIVYEHHIHKAELIAEYFLRCAAKIVAEGAGLHKIDRRIIRSIAKRRLEWVDSKFLNSLFNGKQRPSHRELEKSIERLFSAKVFIGSNTSKGPFRVNPKAWDMKI